LFKILFGSGNDLMAGRFVRFLLVGLFHLPVFGQNGWYMCLSAGNANGISYAFIAKPFGVDTILNRKDKVVNQFKQELMMSQTELYAQNPNRFNQIQTELQSTKQLATDRYNYLVNTLNNRGFVVKEVDFPFYADSIQRIPGFTTLDDDNRLQAITNALADARELYLAKRKALETTQEFQNRKLAATTNWVEKKTGVCKAGGPPPICKDNHWIKTDAEEAQFAYEVFINRKLFEYHDPLVELEEEYQQIALDGKTLKERSKSDTATKPVFYFCKALNVGLRQVVAGQVFSSKVLVKNNNSIIKNFVQEVAKAYPILYEGGEQTVYDLSEAFQTRAQALAKRREYLANWKFVYNYQAFFLAARR
jgi:hypothetical protein